MTRRELQAKHGTPIEFEIAMWRALGELSFDEVWTAVRDYMREWNDAKP